MITIPHCRGSQGVPSGFAELPHRIYAEDPNWIPEVPKEIHRAFQADNPYFLTNKAITYCLPDQARLAVFFNPEARINGHSAAFFGYFETTGELEATRALFSAAEQWAREQGAEDIFGPINFTTYSSNRLRLSAEPGAITFPGEPYNPPTYTDILASLGYEQHQRYYTFITTTDKSQITDKQDVLSNLDQLGFRFQALTPELWLSNLDAFHGMIDDIFADNFAYTPISREAFQKALGEGFIQRACPLTSALALAPDGKIAGFMLNFPHYGPLVTQAAGPDRVALAQLNFATHQPQLQKRGFRVGVLKTLGINPRYRKLGLMYGLIHTVSRQGYKLYDLWMLALIREDNYSARYPIRRKMPKRIYALFHKEL